MVRTACILSTLWLLAAAGSLSASERLRPSTPMIYSGMCDASAGVLVGTNLFLAASDEDNILRLYSMDRGGRPVREFNIGPFLQLERKHPESDIEGAAQIGNRVFWIGSHGRNVEGLFRVNRCGLMATDIINPGPNMRLIPVGLTYRRLVDDLCADARFSKFNLVQASLRAPKDEGGLNIEGIAATPQGGLLIGFRNPIPEGRALLIPLLNPNEVIYGKPARFGEAVTLDLGGNGIRDIVSFRGEYVLIAGAHDGEGRSQVCTWSGRPSDEPEKISVRIRHLNPEGLIIRPKGASAEYFLLSDDGTQVKNGVRCKDLKRPSERSFRAFWLTEQ